MAVSEIFCALGDPIRLEIVQRLAMRQPCTIGEASKGLGISRQGARKHLEILKTCKLVSFERTGRDVNVSLEKQTLEQARSFIGELEQRWDRRLEALKRLVEEG